MEITNESYFKKVLKEDGLKVFIVTDDSDKYIAGMTPFLFYYMKIFNNYYNFYEVNYKKVKSLSQKIVGKDNLLLPTFLFFRDNKKIDMREGCIMSTTFPRILREIKNNS